MSRDDDDDYDVVEALNDSDEEEEDREEKQKLSGRDDVGAVLTDVSSVSAATWEQLREFQAVYGKRGGKDLKVPSVYDKAGMEAKLHEIRMGGEQFYPLPWIEHLTISATGPTLEETLGEQKEDEFVRETAFVQFALEAAAKGYELLEELDVPYLRPDDYYAEMLKTDLHMAKIRRHLLQQQKRIEIVEERKKRREMRKYGKQVQVEKQQTREKVKKEEFKSIKKWRKYGKDGSLDDDDQFLVSIEKNSQDSASGNPKKRAAPSQQQQLSYKKQQELKKPNPKRQRKNEKFGFGGKKRGTKSNTRESTNDFSSFNEKNNRKVPADLKRNMQKRTAQTKRR